MDTVLQVLALLPFMAAVALLVLLHRRVASRAKLSPFDERTSYQKLEKTDLKLLIPAALMVGVGIVAHAMIYSPFLP